MRRTTRGTCGEDRGTQVRRLREVSSREAAEHLARVQDLRGAPTAGKFLKIGTSSPRPPVAEEGEAKARQEERTLRRRRGAVRAAVPSASGSLEIVLEKAREKVVRRSLLGLQNRLPVASASRQLGQESALAPWNLKENGWSKL